MAIYVRKKGSTERIFVAGIGQQGPQGDTGPQGPAGVDGVSPTVTVTDITGGHRVTITDAEGDHAFDVMDGQSGSGGSAGVSSFNGRTGAVTPGSGDYTALQVTFDPGETGMESETVDSAIKELFTSGSEGKALIASAITAKGIDTAADATFQTMSENIQAIQAGGGLPEDVYTVTVAADPPEGGTVYGGGYASKGMIAALSASDLGKYVFKNWEENGEAISDERNYQLKF